MHKRNKYVQIFLLIVSCYMSGVNTSQAACVGRFVNPITDICWSCIFPITVAGIPIASGEDTPNHRSLLCFCAPRVGIPISFWEPVRLVDVTRTPYCMVNLGGIPWGQIILFEVGGALIME